MQSLGQTRHQRKSRVLAERIRFRGKTKLGQIDVDGREVEEIIDENEWLENWTREMCSLSGLEPGTNDFQECQQRMANNVVAGAPLEGVPRGSCDACPEGMTPLLVKARQIGEALGRH